MLHASQSETKNQTEQPKTGAQSASMLSSPLSVAGALASRLAAREGNAPQMLERTPRHQRALRLSQAQSAYGNQAVLRMLKPPVNSPKVLQRKCACNGGGADCAECKEKEKASLQRKANGEDAALSLPPVVHDVLSSYGQPLSREVRAFMEPRFGHDFSDVRLHTDSRAAESARAVDALAYTVGEDVVFGAGQYSAGTSDGQRLIAHELAHVVQQRRGATGAPLKFGATPLVYDDHHLERDAELQASRVMSGQQAQTADGASVVPALQRQPRSSSSSSPPASTTTTPTTAAPTTGIPTPAPTFVCGPDVTTQLKGVVAALRAAWSGWDSTKREEACWSLQNGSCGPVAWDIVQMHNNAWIYQDYRPACASAGATPRCGSSVKIGTDCHNAGSANYVIFGVMCSLCDIWRATMHLMIWAHKIHATGLDPDYDAAVLWADAGYDGWPGATTPAGDRTNCAATCPTPYGKTAHNSATSFDFHWFPSHTTEIVGSACNTALDTKRNPPEPLPGDIGL